MRHALSWGLVTLAIAAAVPAALADDSNVAEQLFREGKRLLGEGKTAEACKAFEGSFRKDEAITTLMNLADCREKNGQFATAWGHFLDAERLGRGKDDTAAYRDIARARAAKLEGRLSFLIINVPTDANVEGLQIFRNGKPVDPAEWNTDIPVDGGEYSIEGKAPGYEAWSTKVKVGAERDKASVNVPRFRTRLQPGGPPGDEPDLREPTETPSGARRKVGLVVAIGGGAALLGGLTVGYLAQQKHADAEAICGADHVCDTVVDQEAAQDLTDQARMRGNISTVVTSVGVVAVATGVVLWLRSGGSTSSTNQARLRIEPVVGPHSVGFAVGGAL